MQRMPTVLLFDVDGTLILTGGAGRRAMVGAFRSLHDRDDIFEGLNFGGMTDRAIARHGLGSRVAQATLDHEIDRLLERYLELLSAELDRTPDYRILPGVAALLEYVAARPGVAVGLGTGNVRRGAYTKLARGGLDRHFAFGGFGCDAEDRTELLRAGARRGAESLGVPYADCRVVVIGDTPKDVAAARGIGARAIAVATGGFSADQLRETGADQVLATLEEDGVGASLLAEN